MLWCALTLKVTAYLAKARSGKADTTGCDMVINATGLGMRETDPLPIAETMLRPDLLAVEIIMKPEETAFLHAAGKRGAALHLRQTHA